MRCGRTERDIFWYYELKDCVGLFDSLVLPQQVKTRRGGYLGHGGEGIGGKGTLALSLCSPDWAVTWRRKGLLPCNAEGLHRGGRSCSMAREAALAGFHIRQQSVSPLCRGSISTSKSLRNDMDPKWTDSCLLKTSFLNAAWVCCCLDVEVNRKWLYNRSLKGLQRQLGYGFSHAPTIIWFSKGHVRSDNWHGPFE